MSETVSFYDIEVTTIDGKPMKMGEFRGQTLLIVNVASQCGFTNQYAGLEKLHLNYRNRGFQVLGFPCNQFGGQEPGDEQEIKNFCNLNYQVTFPLFKKIEVNGDGTHPLYQFLKREKKGVLGSQAIKWNFTKFLISRSGTPLKRFAPGTQPAELEDEIEKALSMAKNID